MLRRLVLALGLVVALASSALADRAFFIVQGPDVRSPINYLAGYDILVCNPSLDPDAVRAKAPEATVFGYLNSRMIPLYGQGSPFYDGFREAMDRDEWYFLDANGERKVDSRYGQWLLRSDRLDAYSALAAWAGENLAGWDGIYIDEFWGEMPTRVLDERGVDDPDVERLRFAAAMTFLESALRFYLPGKVVIANIGFGYPPPGDVDAITIENGHLERMGYAIGLWRFYSYANGREGRRGDLNVAWGAPLEAEGLVARGDIFER